MYIMYRGGQLRFYGSNVSFYVSKTTDIIKTNNVPHSGMGKVLTLKFSNINKTPIFHTTMVLGFMPYTQFFPLPSLPLWIFLVG